MSESAERSSSGNGINTAISQMQIIDGSSYSNNSSNNSNAGSSSDLPKEFQLFEDVRRGFRENQSLAYVLSADSLRGCLNVVHTPEAQAFIDEFLLRIITILLAQNPSRLGQFERNAIEESMNASILIILHILHKPVATQCLLKLFDSSSIYYAGQKANWTQYNGYPAVRLQIARRFAEKNGFLTLATSLMESCSSAVGRNNSSSSSSSSSSGANNWIGAAGFGIILSTMIEVITEDQIDVMEQMIEVVTNLLLNITDENAKKDISEKASSMTELIHTIDQLKMHYGRSGSKFVEELNYPLKSFGLMYALKMICSSSIVLKLFGWDQINDFIREAHSSRPYAKSYTVFGAGTTSVNGVYRMRNSDVDRIQSLKEYTFNAEGMTNVPAYTKAPSSPEEPLLTLFRCQIAQSSNFWWFISIADEQNPGTDSDIDYYQHKSKKHEEREPPTRGWNSLGAGTTNNSVSQKYPGAAPAPRLIRGDSFVLPESKTSENYLYCVLSQWVRGNDILTKVFNQQSVHREIVLRCTGLIEYLADSNNLTPSDLELIWETCCHTHDSDVSDEILSLLCDVSVFLSEKLFVFLMQMIEDDLVLKKGGSGSNSVNTSPSNAKDSTSGAAYSSNKDSIQRVAQFLEKYCSSDFSHIDRLGPSAVVMERLLGLVWKLYKSPLYSQIKYPQSIQDLLSKCLSTCTGSSFAAQGIFECVALLAQVNSNDSIVDEDATSRVVETLQFLVAKHAAPDSLLDLKARGFENILLNEIERFVLKSRSAPPLQSLLSGVSTSWYSKQLESRLLLLRSFYGVSADVKITEDVLNRVWSFLMRNKDNVDVITSDVTISTYQIDLQSCFNFLRTGIRKEIFGNAQNHVEIFCNKGTLFYIFSTFLCDESVDWGLAGLVGFKCFNSYTAAIEKISKADSYSGGSSSDGMNEVGLQTLWRIYLSADINTVEVGDTLLKAYDQSGFSLSTASDAQESLCKKIYDHMVVELKKLKSTNQADRASFNSEKIKRCLNLILAAISNDCIYAGEIQAVKSTMSRIILRVKHYRYVRIPALHTSGKDSIKVDKDSEGVEALGMHPMQTLGDLRSKVSNMLNWKNLSNFNIEGNWDSSAVADTTRLSSLHLTDGSVITAAYQTGNNNHNITFGPSMSSVGGYDCHNDTSQNKAYSPAAVNAHKRCHAMSSLVAGNKYYFDVLINIATSSTDEEISTLIWKVVMLLPTNKDMFDSIARVLSMNPSTFAAEQKWSIFFNHDKMFQTSYSLHIVAMLLQPSEDFITVPSFSELAKFKSFFIMSGGPAAVLHVFKSVNDFDKGIFKVALASALHIMFFLLFDRRDCDNDNDVNTTGGDDGYVSISKSLLKEMIENSPKEIVEKLLLIATDGSKSPDQSSIVHDALVTIGLMLENSANAASFIVTTSTSPTSGRVSNAGNSFQLKELLSITLHSGSKRVREISADFSIQVGRLQPVVFTWLLELLDAIDYRDRKVQDIFRAITSLLNDYKSSSDIMISSSSSSSSSSSNIPLELASYLSSLAELLSKKLLLFMDAAACRSSGGPAINLHASEFMLGGFLELLASLLAVSADSVIETEFGRNIIDNIFKEFLFPVPSDSQDKKPICDDSATRIPAFGVLQMYIAAFPAALNEVFANISKLASSAVVTMKGTWGVQCSQDARRADVSYSGLKNQGCTCYVNSLLQQLFINSAFRKAVMSTPIKECHRNSLSHLSNEDLIGRKLLVQWSDDSWRPATAEAYYPVTNLHKIVYTDVIVSESDSITDSGSDGSSTCYVLMNIRDSVGRPQMETGRVRIAPLEAEESATEAETAAYAVLEQLQRTFCYLQYSNRRSFDPRQFIECCKTLNMNFSVYQQNDAAELYDQLLDRIETASKGKHTKKDMWSGAFLPSVFGGTYLNQKIPQECASYSAEKATCGHWQSSKTDLFLKMECLVRGKEKVTDSLDELVAGELMNGDNKIQCDVCCQKKDTFRRTILQTLPNTLVLHLKRFDLDYTTFETVKLNNRVTFPMHFNVQKYTKECMDWEEYLSTINNAPVNSGSGGNIHYDTDMTEPNPEDYEYELQGVLVHAGIAQGGHYYSFAKDSESDGDDWYRFDDEEVTRFNSDNIAAQCFGGPPTGPASNGEDRTYNAFMLFFKKTKTVSNESVKIQNKPASEVEPTAGTALVDGYQAFIREVQDSNLHHLLSCYFLDSDLHSFVRQVLRSSISKVGPGASFLGSGTGHEVDLLLAVKHSIYFLLDIVLHCRDVYDLAAWVETFTAAFEFAPVSAVWFLDILAWGSGEGQEKTTWVVDYLQKCVVASSRSTFAAIVVSAIKTCAQSATAADADWSTLLVTAASAASSDYDAPTRALRKILPTLMDMVCDIPQYRGVSEDLVLLIRDLAAVKSIRAAILPSKIITKLCFFVSQNIVTDDGIRRRILESSSKANGRGGTRGGLSDSYGVIHLPVVEAIAALLGSSQTRRVPLLFDHSNFYTKDLTHEARAAFGAIFKDFLLSDSANKMDTNDFAGYLRRVRPSLAFSADAHARQIVERYHMQDDNANGVGLMSLGGFLSYYADLAFNSPREAWDDLTACGFRNDLSRYDPSLGAADAGDDNGSFTDVISVLPQSCLDCVLSLGFYTSSFAVSDLCALAALRQVCRNNGALSVHLASQAVSELYALARDNSTSQQAQIIVELIKGILETVDSSTVNGSSSNDLFVLRLQTILSHESYGLIDVICKELQHPTRCGTNEYDSQQMFKAYTYFLQELCTISKVATYIAEAAEADSRFLLVKGFLRLQPGSDFTDNERQTMETAIVRVHGAGQGDCNGDYIYTDIKEGAGFYSKKGTYRNETVTYTLYKCGVTTGGSQWFLSITPAGKSPGTKDDIDFYYSTCAERNRSPLLPPSLWLSFNNVSASISPPPSVTTMVPGPNGSIVAVNYGTVGNRAGRGGGSCSDSDDHDTSSVMGSDDDYTSMYPGVNSNSNSSPNNSFGLFDT